MKVSNSVAFGLTLAALAGVVGCSPKNDAAQSGPKSLENTAISEELDLTEVVIREYRSTGDESKLRAYATNLEQSYKEEDAFRLYEAIGDKRNMERMALNYFVGCMFLDNANNLMDRAGLKPNTDLWNKRGDYHFGMGWYDDALEAYKKAGNTEGMRKVAKKYEENYKSSDAFEAYVLIGDTNSAYRVAERSFIESSRFDDGQRMLKKLGKTTTAELWNLRGAYQLSNNRYDDALEAYRRAKNTNGINQVMQRALTPR